MVRSWLSHTATLLLLFVLACPPAFVHAEERDSLADLHRNAVRLSRQGRYVEALPLATRLLSDARKRYGEEHADVAAALVLVGDLLEAQGRYAEAEPLYKRALTIWEKTLGPDHLTVANTLGTLAWLYERQGRFVEAEALSKRSLSITEKALGPNHASVATRLNNLAFLYRAAGRYAEAESLFIRALSISEKELGPNSPAVGTELDNLATLYRAMGRYAEAEPLHKRGLAIREIALGPDHPSVGGSLANLGALYKIQGRYAEAEPLYLRSLRIREKARGPDHPDVAKALNNLALLYFAQHDWARAVDYWRRSTGVTIRRAMRGTDDVGQALTGKRKDEAEQVGERFRNLVKAGHLLSGKDSGIEPTLLREMFVVAQWAEGSEAAASLAQMAVRGAKGNPSLAIVVRERQDLVAEWQKLDAARTSAVSQAPDKRDPVTEAANVARLDAIDARVADIDKRLAVDFPDYAALSRPQPLSIEDVQSQLRADEALVLFLDTPAWNPTPEATFIWVVTKTEARWVRSPLGTSSLVRNVAALRCGLDASLWDDEAARGSAHGRRDQFHCGRRIYCVTEPSAALKPCAAPC
jgi:tetratricopeptide (TPR) repeat protein